MKQLFWTKFKLHLQKTHQHEHTNSQLSDFPLKKIEVYPSEKFSDALSNLSLNGFGRNRPFQPVDNLAEANSK